VSNDNTPKTHVYIPVKSPCIGVCSTGIGDSVCRGCKRFSHEIIYWNGYNEPERQAVAQRLQYLLSQAVKAKITVVDVEQLRAALDFQKIHYHPDANQECWVFALLKAGATQIEDPSHYGCELTSDYQDYDMRRLRDEIDSDFYTLSSVHYERYFHRH